MSQANYRNEEAIAEARKVSPHSPSPVREQVIEINEGQGPQTIALDWSVVFQQRFSVSEPMTQDEFLALAREHIEWLKSDFLKQLQKYPQELLKTLAKNGLLQSDTFK